MNKILAWVTANGRGVSIGTLVLAGFLAYFQTSIKVAPSDEVHRQAFTPTYVGGLTLQKGSHTGTDARYGIGVPNDRESNSLLKQLRPTVYIAFHPDLKVTEKDIASGIKPGFAYTVDLWQGQIIAIADENRGIISREEYEARVEAKKRLFLYWSVALTAAAAIVWGMTVLRRKAHDEA